MTDKMDVNHSATATRASDASIEDYLAFERLLADISVRFANISGHEFDAEIKTTLKRLLDFLRFDRCTFTEFTANGWAKVVYSEAVEGVVPLSAGPYPTNLAWLVEQTRAGKIVALRSFDDIPPEAVNIAEYFRRRGLRAVLRLPVAAGGRIIGGLSFSAYRSTRDWPDELIARLKIVGDLVAQALTRTRAEEAHRASEARLRSAQEELARLSRLATMGEMAAIIAHEINQPLAAIAANSSSAQRWLSRAHPDLDEARSAMEYIARDVHRAGEVIKSTRAMFKLDNRKSAPVAVNDIISDVFMIVDDEIQELKIRVRSDLGENLPQVIGDRGQLLQVFVNLIKNAIDAMKPVTDRERILVVKSKILDQEIAQISIGDSGTGISPEDAERIFSPFFTTKSDGLGIGLSICRSIIDDHNGRMWVSPGSPHGTVINVALPGNPQLKPEPAIF
jgi:signal transduction histidine kinase